MKLQSKTPRPTNRNCCDPAPAPTAPRLMVLTGASSSTLLLAPARQPRPMLERFGYQALYHDERPQRDRVTRGHVALDPSCWKRAPALAHRGPA